MPKILPNIAPRQSLLVKENNSVSNRCSRNAKNMELTAALKKARSFLGGLKNFINKQIRACRGNLHFSVLNVQSSVEKKSAESEVSRPLPLRGGVAQPSSLPSKLCTAPDGTVVPDVVPDDDGEMDVNTHLLPGLSSLGQAPMATSIGFDISGYAKAGKGTVFAKEPAVDNTDRGGGELARKEEPLYAVIGQFDSEGKVTHKSAIELKDDESPVFRQSRADIRADIRSANLTAPIKPKRKSQATVLPGVDDFSAIQKKEVPSGLPATNLRSILKTSKKQTEFSQPSSLQEKAESSGKSSRKTVTFFKEISTRL